MGRDDSESGHGLPSSRDGDDRRSQKEHEGGTRDETIARRIDDRREGYVRRDEHYRYTKGQSGVGYANG